MTMRLLFIVVFLGAGVLGHDPWKQDETYSFGIINHFYMTHSWLVPVNAGVPFMEKPPLYYWTALLLCKMLGGLLPLHDAARLASVVYMGVAMVFIGMASRLCAKAKPVQQPGDNSNTGTDGCHDAVLLFLGTLGIVRHSHDMFTDVALLAGAAVALYAMALLVCARAGYAKSGFWLGLGIGMVFLSKGLFFPIVLVTGSIILVFLLPELRSARTLKAVAIAAITASPFLFIWTGLLYHYSPVLFMEWFWDNNVGRFLGFSVPKLGAGNPPFYMLYTIIWFAFPVFPLAVFGVYQQGKAWKQPQYLLPLIVSATGFCLLLVSASARALYCLPLIPFLTLLAAKGLEGVPPAFLKYWNRVVITLSFAVTIAIWLLWISLQLPPSAWFLPHRVMLNAGEFLPLAFLPDHTQWVAMTMAVLALTGLLQVARIPQPSASLVWFTAIATCWITISTLLLPWMDVTKSYRSVLNQMQDFIAGSPYKTACLNNANLGESIAPMLEYMDKTHPFHPVSGFADSTCPLLLMVTGKNAETNPQPGWKLVWQGTRTLDSKDEELRLYGRIF